MSTELCGIPPNRPPTLQAFSHMSIQDRGRPDFRNNEAMKLEVIPAPTMRYFVGAVIQVISGLNVCDGRCPDAHDTRKPRTILCGDLV